MSSNNTNQNNRTADEQSEDRPVVRLPPARPIVRLPSARYDARLPSDLPVPGVTPYRSTTPPSPSSRPVVRMPPPSVPSRSQFLVDGILALSDERTNARPTDICGICREPIAVDTQADLDNAVVIVRCGHIFHKDCLWPWLMENPTSRVVTCPMCRQPLFRTPDHASNAAPEARNFPPAVVNARAIARIDAIMARSSGIPHDEDAHIAAVNARVEQAGEAAAVWSQVGGMPRLLQLQRQAVGYQDRGEAVPQELITAIDELQATLLDSSRRANDLMDDAYRMSNGR